MSSRNSIDTVTSAASNATDQAQTPVTGTDSGTKRGLDTFILGSNLTALHALMPLIMGTLPDTNYDQIQRTVNVDGSETFVFLYKDIPEFEFSITDPNGDFDISIIDFSLLKLQQGGYLGLQDGSDLALRGA